MLIVRVSTDGRGAVFPRSHGQNVSKPHGDRADERGKPEVITAPVIGANWAAISRSVVHDDPRDQRYCASDPLGSMPN